MFLIGRHTNEGISTHILTKRMTKGITVGSTVTIISTHILTKRMTQSKHGSRKWQLNFNSHPHEEDDHHPLLSYTSQYHFNSHPHEEDDKATFRWLVCYTYFNSHPHEEDDGFLPVLWWHGIISTHILTKRMTESRLKTGRSHKFQLTSSRRG